MNIAIFYNSSLVNPATDLACHLRGVLSELLMRGHKVKFFERREGEGENEDQGGDPDEDSKEQPKDQDENGKPDAKPGEGEPKPQQPKPGQLSPEQIKSLLEAMNNEEKKVQDKINAERAKGTKTRNEKDW